MEDSLVIQQRRRRRRSAGIVSSKKTKKNILGIICFIIQNSIGTHSVNGRQHFIS